MLFTYPIQSSVNNWLHECIIQIVVEDFHRVDRCLPDLNWPDCVASTHRKALKRYTALRDWRVKLINGYKILDLQQRQSVKHALDDQSALEDLFNGGRTASHLLSLPRSSREAVVGFFEKAFEMLAPLGIRDENYKIFLSNVPNEVCGFCGCEYFSGVKSKREPLDHYLAVSLYPFAGSNTRNLVPMGPKCNSSYKLSQDVLRDRSGTRRVCFDPYVSAPVQISLMATRLFARPDGLPDWAVDFAGDGARIDTWNDVFDIRRRFIDDHLDSIYKNSIKVYKTLRLKQPNIVAGLGITGAFRLLGDLSREKGWADRAFLETAVYDLLEARSSLGGAEASRISQEFGATV